MHISYSQARRWTSSPCVNIPAARPSPVAPATPMLVAGSQGLVLPVSTNETAMQHEHHQAAPTNKPAQKPAEHKHEHEQPKKEEKK